MQRSFKLNNVISRIAFCTFTCLGFFCGSNSLYAEVKSNKSVKTIKQDDKSNKEALIIEFKKQLKKELLKINEINKKHNNEDYKYMVYVNSESIEQNGLDPDQVLPIGTLSTQFTAYILFDAIVAKYGKDKLKEIVNTPLKNIDALNNFCSSIKCTWIGEVTMHQLLSHTSGIMGGDHVKRVLAINTLINIFFAPSLTRTISGLSYQESYRSLGTFQYSIFNYVILRMIAEELSGKKFDDLVKDLAKKKGLTSLVNLSGSSSHDAMRRNPNVYRPILIPSYLPTDIVCGATMIAISAKDWIKFTKDFYGSEIFKIGLDNSVFASFQRSVQRYCYGISCGSEDSNKIDSDFTFSTYCSLNGMLLTHNKHDVYVVCALDNCPVTQNVFACIESVYDSVFNSGRYSCGRLDTSKISTGAKVQTERQI